MLSAPASGATARSAGVPAAADAYVRADAPNTNFGARSSLRIKGAPASRAYIRFDLTGTGGVGRAILRLYLERPRSPRGIRVRAIADDGWEERTITFSNAPRVGRLLGSAGSSNRRMLLIDVSQVVLGGRPVTFAITTADRRGGVLVAREARRRPTLLVTYEPAPTTFSIPVPPPTSLLSPAPAGPAGPQRALPPSPPAPTPPPDPTPPQPDPTPPPPNPTPPTPDPTPPPPPAGGQPGFPIRAAFYYPWFPETWTVGGVLTHFNPTLGLYNSTDATVVDQHIRWLDWSKVNVAISSWWGQQSREDSRFPLLLDRTRALRSELRWTLYYEEESLRDPTPAEIEGDLSYIKSNYATDSRYLAVGGKPVIFVYADGADACGMADRWQQANASQGFYVVLKVFPGYQACVSQPESWHQYAPASAAQHAAGYSYAISPGFWKADEASPRLGRDLTRWAQNTRDMVASGAPWQLITTFNEWGEGTAVESASEWSSCVTCPGDYVEALHWDGLVPAAGDPVIAAAGDIACSPGDGSFNGGSGTGTACRQLHTSNLLQDPRVAAVLPLGDLQYEDGALSRFQGSYDLSWGRFKALTHPVAGNHEYGTSDAAGYFDYFNGAGIANGPAGERGKGYYSYDVGSWHLIALNSNCGETGGCGAGSPQEQWLRADLAAHPTSCTLAYWHHPRFNSGREYGDDARTGALWQALYDANAEVVLSGHEHVYERQAPRNPSGAADPQRGIRQFVVGTGGKNRYDFTSLDPTSEAHSAKAYGVLKLTLHAGSYQWSFEPDSGSTFTDSGSAGCH